MKFTAISTRFMNLDCESPIHAALEQNILEYIILRRRHAEANCTHAVYAKTFGRLFLSCTVIHHSGRHRRHQHDDNDDDADDDDDADAITTLTLNRPPLHQHQESDSLLVGFAVKV